ncbi:enoyl-CoA hydratase, partial [Mycobacterium sp. ITM-2017-0098]
MGNSYESVTVDRGNPADHIATVTLIGPGKGNAMGPAFWAELPIVFGELDADPEVRAIVLTGSGKNFSYGLDLAAMGDTLGSMMADGSSSKPRADFHARLKTMQYAITAVADCRTPTIASVHGWCIGGGV